MMAAGSRWDGAVDQDADMNGSEMDLTTRPATGRRIEVLDVLRGVAILGTLGTNIWFFTDPLGPVAGVSAQMDSLASGVEAALRFLANGKFLSVLALMFGVGLELQYRSAQRRGQRWPGWYLWRSALLLMEGLLHYVLLFEWDVLMSYAVTSVIAAYLIGRSDRVVHRWIIAVAALHTLAMTLITVGMIFAPAPAEPQPTANQSNLFTDGSYLDQVTSRLDHMLLFRLEAIFIIPMSIVLFLLGSRLLRAGAFEDSAHGARLRVRLMVIGLGTGLPLNLLTALAGPEWFFLSRYVLPALVALGLLGLVTTLTHRLRDVPGMLRHGFTAVGRAALSCYVFQNLVASVLCYGWGLGLAAKFDALRPWWVIGAWAAISVLVMVLATAWLRRFTRGPVELAWNWAYHAL